MLQEGVLYSNRTSFHFNSMWLSWYSPLNDVDLEDNASNHTTIDTKSHYPNEVKVHAYIWDSTINIDASKDNLLTNIWTTDINLLRKLHVINGSYVIVRSSSGKMHIATLTFCKSMENASGTNISICISPLLAFNIGISLHATNKSEGNHIFLSLRPAIPEDFGANISQLGLPLRLREQKPLIAEKAVIAPLLFSRLMYHRHKNISTINDQESLTPYLQRYFQECQQVLQKGDIFPIIVQEKTISSEQVAKLPPAYTPITIPKCLLGEDFSMDTMIAPPSLVLKTHVIYFRVESIYIDVKSNVINNADKIAYRICPDSTTLIQSTAVSARAPDENIIRNYVSYCSGQECPRNLVCMESNQFLNSGVRRLIDVLTPAMHCNLPTSILIVGPRGIGKATTVQSAAKVLGLQVVQVPFTTLSSVSELHMIENLNTCVEQALALAPCILYLRRFFTVSEEYHGPIGQDIRLSAALTTHLQRLGTQAQDKYNIPLIACVENISDLPLSLRETFLFEIELDTPSTADREEFLRSSTIKYDDEVDLENIIQATAGRTFGELQALITDAATLAIHRHLKNHSLDGDFTSISIQHNEIDRAYNVLQKQLSESGAGTIATVPNVKWEDVGGLENVKSEIIDMIQLPREHPELFAAGLKQRSGILFYGPPGTGKTLLAKAIATECQMNFLSVKGPEVLNMYIGESEKNVRELFAKARRCRPCILFFDELDSLAPMRGRGSDSGGVMDRIVSQLLTEIDGLSGSSQGDVFVIGATNRPDLLETALLRPGRFDRLLYLGICTDSKMQLKIVQALTRKFLLAKDVDLSEVIQNCPRTFTGADFYALCSRALAMALKERVTMLEKEAEELNALECYSSGETTVRTLLNQMSEDELQTPVYQKHFLESLRDIVPSVSPTELLHYEKLKEQYSST